MKPDDWRFILYIECDLLEEEIVARLFNLLPGAKKNGGAIEFKGHVLNLEINSMYVEDFPRENGGANWEHYKYEIHGFPVTSVDSILQKLVINEVEIAARQLGFEFLLIADCATETFEIQFPDFSFPKV
ncbi:hypothetical protein ABIC33_004616 [Variovorax sp. 1140]|uniref:hypothetical protein n=1 Tax=Variovorax atrisoli TaxID=3394203 RepID=UPI00339AC6DA